MALVALSVAGCLAPDMTPFVTHTDSATTTPTVQASNRAAAQAIIKAIASRDTGTIERLVSPDRYRRHDNRISGDRSALIDFLSSPERANWQAKTVRTLVDGDYVVTHNEYRSAGKVYAGFEVYRFDAGRAIESWKAMQLMPPPNPSGRTLLDGATEIVDRERVRENKVFTGRVAREIMFKGNFKLIPEMMGDPYIQHNPLVADGIEGLKAEADKREKGALWAFDYKEPLLLLGEGNFTVTMMNIEYNGEPALHFDLFRIQNGKLGEHWDLYEIKRTR